MPKAKKKTKKTNAFELQLGNTEERGGHRRDCSQVAVRLVCKKDQCDGTVGEESAQQFLDMIEEHLHNMLPFELEIWDGFVAEITFNTSRVTLKDVKEVKA